MIKKHDKHVVRNNPANPTAGQYKKEYTSLWPLSSGKMSFFRSVALAAVVVTMFIFAVKGEAQYQQFYADEDYFYPQQQQQQQPNPFINYFRPNSYMMMMNEFNRKRPRPVPNNNPMAAVAPASSSSHPSDQDLAKIFFGGGFGINLIPTFQTTYTRLHFTHFETHFICFNILAF